MTLVALSAAFFIANSCSGHAQLTGHATVSASPSQRMSSEIHATKPVLLRRGPIERPPITTPEEIEGTTVLDLTVDVLGHVASAVVKRSSGYNVLDSIALRSAEQSLFKPATSHGHAVEGHYTLALTITIQ